MQTLQVANTIREQLGGRRFEVMTGAKDFMGDADSLAFKLPRGARDGINYVKITLAADLYTVTFYKFRGVNITPVYEVVMIQADQLREVFTRYTGLETSLGTMRA